MTDYLSIEGAKLLNRNAERFNTVINSDNLTYLDENSITRYTVKGYEALASPDNSEGLTFAAGGTLTRRNQVVYKSDGSFWQWNGTLPKTWSAGFDPTTNTGSLAWINKGDLSLRNDLNQTSGATLVKTSTGATVESRLSSQDTSIAGKAALAGSSSQVFSVADATADAQSASLGQVKLRTKKGGLTQSILANALTLTQAKKLFNFRSATLTDGTATEVTPSSDITLTIPSGASLGLTSGIPGDILEILLYNGGTPVIGVVNAAGGLVLDESGLISSTAISATATSASVVYSSVAVTNSPYIILNRLSVTLPTAGAWSVLPTVTSLDLTGSAILQRKVSSPPLPTTSGTAISVPNIPSWAKRISIVFDDVKTATASALLVQVGNSSLVTSGYSSGATVVSTVTGNNTSGASSTAGFIAINNAAGQLNEGKMTLDVLQSSVIESHSMYPPSGNVIGNGSGKLALTGGVTQLALTTVAGNVAFSGGAITLVYEG